MNVTEHPPVSQKGETDEGGTGLSRHDRRVLLAIITLVLAFAIGLAVYQQMSPGLRLRAEGFTKVGTVNDYDVWTKVTGDRIQLHVLGDGGDLCPGGGPFSPGIESLCADESDGWSAFVAVVPLGTTATVVTHDAGDVTATVLHEPLWPYALAVQVSNDSSLFGATLK